MSGGTRCNITHATDNRGIVEAYGPPGKFLHSALAALSVQDTDRLLRGRRRRHQGRGDRQDLPGQQQGRRRARRPAAPAGAQRRRAGAGRAGAGTATQRRSRLRRGHAARAASARPSVILTTGGQSYPGSGTTGDGYRLAAAFGHTIVPPRPALVPITVAAPWVAELRGVTLPDVAVRVLEAGPNAGQPPRLAAVRPLRPVRAGGPRRQPGRQRPRRARDADAGDRLAAGPEDEQARRVAARRIAARPARSSWPWSWPRSCRAAWPTTLLPLAGLAADRKAAALSKPDRPQAGAMHQALAAAGHGHARLREGGSDGRRRGAGRSRFADDAKQAACRACTSPAKCSTWTARSAATTSRRRGAPAGWREGAFTDHQRDNPRLMRHLTTLGGFALAGGPIFLHLLASERETAKRRR